MFLKNVKEDMVMKIIQDILQDPSMKEICRCSICIEDIASYVLNRTQPYYITSGRGILHLEKDIEPLLQDQADLYALTIQAIKIINGRRKKTHTIQTKIVQENIMQEEYYISFPYIVGRVLDVKTLKPKSEISIELYRYEKENYVLCPMVDENWFNPYFIPKEFAGYFIFLPAPLLAADQNKHSKQKINFKIIIGQEEYEEEFSLELFSDRFIHSQMKNRYELKDILI